MGLAGAAWIRFAKNPRIELAGRSMNARSQAVMLHVDVGQQVFTYECLRACAAVVVSQQRQASTADLRNGQLLSAR